MMYKPKKANLRKLRDFQKNDFGIDGYLRRIKRREKAGLINMIIIDGISQSGKTTFGRSICEVFDPNYVTIFKIRELMKFLRELKSRGEYKDYVWVLIDEPQNEVDKNEWWDQRNKALTKIMSSYGFQHVNVVMCLPNVKRLSDSILTNLSLRISVVANFNERTNEIVRKAFIKKAMWSDKKNKHIWITTEVHTIQDIPKNEEYEKRKRDVYYNNLEEWDKELEVYERGYTDNKTSIDDNGNIIHKSVVN
jgi:hypothetical protein